jgi:hypothetical protein
MSLIIINEDFEKAKSLIRDIIFKQTANISDKDNLGVLKLIKSREENIDFEIGLAERLCGDNKNYPYRSSFYITKFFKDLGFNFEHDGTTRRTWIKNKLETLDTSKIASIIKYGLFKKSDYKNVNLRTETSKSWTDEEFLKNAVNDFQSFISDSIKANEVLDLGEILNLNVNIELLFESNAVTQDDELNALVNEAKNRYLRTGDQHVALEKIWDAFERIKTYYGADKKKASQQLISEMAKEIDVGQLNQEFEQLTKIGNTYRIRHHETDKIEINDDTQIKYLFFRMLSLIDLALESVKRKEEN